jgi:YetA-like protein
LSETTRREFLKDAALAGAAITACTLAEDNLLAAAAQTREPDLVPGATSPGTVTLSWLGEQPPLVSAGVSWGMPWPQGVVRRDSRFHLSAPGKELPLQTWPLAHWPDGSIKWSGFATVVPAGMAAPVTLSPGSLTISSALKITNSGKSIVVDTGVLQCAIPSAGGADLVESMTIEGRVIVGAAELVCILQTGPDISTDEVRPREKFVSLVKKVTVEQSGRFVQ